MAKKILVVDDEPDILKVVLFRLKKLGYETSFVSDGALAVEAAREQRPDMVFLDVRLPNKDGYHICSEIKADPALAAVPIVMMTASCQDIKNKITVCGANDYLIKPFNPEDLLAKLALFAPV